MYILKIKGKARIPDFIQLRDEDFTLVGYFRMDGMEKNLKAFLPGYSKILLQEIQNLPYGRFLPVK